MTKRSGQFTTILWHGYDVSGDLNQYDMAFEHAEDDATGFMALIENMQAGISKFTGKFTTMINPDTGRSHDVFRLPTANANKLVSFMIGNGAIPVIGDPAMMGLVTQFTYSPRPSAKSLILGDITFNNGTSNVRANPNGYVLAFTTITATTEFTYRDNLVESLNGGVGIVHVITPTAADTYEVKCQDSPDHITWGDLCTFDLDGQTITAERQTFSGTVDRYERAIATRTGAVGEDFKLAVNMARL